MLNHREYLDQDLMKTALDLDQMAEALDQKHRMQRKIQFFLDIRGYLLMNKIKGDYIEFGVFKGEMMYCAWKILEKTACLSRYIGLDTFCGEPEFTQSDVRANATLHKGDYPSEYEKTRNFLGFFIKEKLSLICGDFRSRNVQDKISVDQKSLAVAVIDCNLLSSIEVSLEYILPRMVCGGVLFIDDFFFNMAQGSCPLISMLEKAEKQYNYQIIEYQTYAPFARAFIIADNEY